MLNKKKVGIIAPSSPVPPVEFQLGLEKLRGAGFQLKVHPQCHDSHLYYSGEDEVRAKALFEYAKDEDLSVIWCARGGSGGARLLPFLDQFTKKSGKPGKKKLLVGFSDATVL